MAHTETTSAASEDFIRRALDALEGVTPGLCSVCGDPLVLCGHWTPSLTSLLREAVVTVRQLQTERAVEAERAAAGRRLLLGAPPSQAGGGE